jgi:hypothetical protein
MLLMMVLPNEHFGQVIGKESARALIPCTRHCIKTTEGSNGLLGLSHNGNTPHQTCQQTLQFKFFDE